jgi:hypothetical protein
LELRDGKTARRSGATWNCAMAKRPGAQGQLVPGRHCLTDNVCARRSILSDRRFYRALNTRGSGPAKCRRRTASTLIGAQPWGSFTPTKGEARRDAMWRLSLVFYCNLSETCEVGSVTLHTRRQRHVATLSSMSLASCFARARDQATVATQCVQIRLSTRIDSRSAAMRLTARVPQARDANYGANAC